MKTRFFITSIFFTSTLLPFCAVVSVDDGIGLVVSVRTCSPNGYDLNLHLIR